MFGTITGGGRRLAIPTTRNWGIGLAFGTALISGLAIFVNAYAVKQLPDAAVYTTLKNGLAAVILLVLAGLIVPRAEVTSVSRRDWGKLLVIGVVGGSVPFILFFSGLAQATAPSAAFIQKTLFIWVALLAVPFLGERLGWTQIAAIGVLLVGQALVLPPNKLGWGSGETMIAAATALWAIEVVIAKKTLASVSAPIVGAARLGIGLVVLVGYLVFAGKTGIVAALGVEQWAWGLGTGAILAAYVATWFAALQRAPASVVTAVLVVGAVITAALQGLANGTVPGTTVVAGYVLILGAAGAVAYLARRASAATHDASVARLTQ